MVHKGGSISIISKDPETKVRTAEGPADIHNVPSTTRKLHIKTAFYILTCEQAVQVCCEALGCPLQKGHWVWVNHSSSLLSLPVW